jgi:hypothetical protein
MEWHFNYTPYHYTFNNPINFFDPFGLDTVDSKHVNWTKFDPENDIIRFPGATVSSEGYTWVGRLFRKIRRAINGGNSTYVKDGGIEFTTKSNSGGNESSTARTPDSESENIDLIFALKPNAGPKIFGFDPLGLAKSIKSAGKGINEAKGTSDKEIVENSTGTAEKKDAHGKPVEQNDYKPEGQETDSSVIQKTYYFDDVDGDTVQDWRVHKFTNMGRPVSKKYIKKAK